MGYVNAKIARLKPSETLAVKTKANELKAAGREVLDLSTGEPDIDTPQHIKDAAAKAMRDGKTKYTAVAGIPELRKAIAQKLTEQNKLQIAADQVIVTAGGKHALYALFDSILEPGDEVIVFAPYWVSYLPMVQMAGGTAVVVEPGLGDGLRISPDRLKAALTPKTKAVILNSPSNPTGIGYNRAQLIEFGKVLESSAALIVSDEVYEKTTYDHFTFCSFGDACSDLQSRLVTINAFSKSYSMTGWRVGYAAGPKEIISALERHQSQATSSVCSIAQYAALGALSGPHDFLTEMNGNFARRMALASRVIEETPGLELRDRPDGAFYLFVHYDKERLAASKIGLKGSTELVNFFLEKGGVAAVQGEAFGDDSAFRISVAASDDSVGRGIQAISECMKELMAG
jgi:aspartate aminotransferase